MHSKRQFSVWKQGGIAYILKENIPEYKLQLGSQLLMMNWIKEILTETVLLKAYFQNFAEFFSKFQIFPIISKFMPMMNIEQSF